MDKKQEAEILIELEQILLKDMPNELKCDLILKTVVERLLDDQRSQYERLIFVDRSRAN